MSNEKETWTCKEHGDRVLLHGEACPGEVRNKEGGLIKSKPHGEAA